MSNTTPLLAELVDKENEIEILRALRRKLAVTIDASNSGRDIAALARQLQQVNEKIAQLESVPADTVLDQIMAKHAAHRVR